VTILLYRQENQKMTTTLIWQAARDRVGSMHRGEVNPHCLDRIIRLSEKQDILAEDDICDDKGIKLLAKGSKVSRTCQESLIHRKLARPLEMSLALEEGIKTNEIVGECQRLCDEHSVLRQIAGSKTAQALLADFQRTPLPASLKLLLTSARETGRTSHTHSIYSVAICAGIAARLNISDHDAQLLLLSGLVGNLGEMYINPDYLGSEKKLNPQEWQHLAMHPHIGRIVIDEFTDLPAAVGICVSEHHERMDGSGYPGQLSRQKISRLGGLLAVADSASAIVGHAGENAAPWVALALRIVPGEFASSAVNALTQGLNGSASEYKSTMDIDCLEMINAVQRRLENSTRAAESLVARAPSITAAEHGEFVLSSLGQLRKSLRATGADQVWLFPDITEDPELLGEIILVVREIEWRMRSLARIVSFRASTSQEKDDLLHVAETVAALDEVVDQSSASAEGAVRLH
jgi:HD-GYP domain-containing protein (c-di-GMP phosphodiesterase class II)